MTRYGELTSGEIEELLRDQYVARIACVGPRGPHIFPISYAYDGTFAYGYSYDGRKMQLMLEDPRVCFEIDDVRSAIEWRSVIADGRFEALSGQSAYCGLELLSARQHVPPAATGRTGVMPTFVTRRGGYGTVFRIRLSEKSGRFERAEPDALLDAT